MTTQNLTRSRGRAPGQVQEGFDVVPEMNRSMKTLLFGLLCLVVLVAVVVLWPFAVAGFLALALSGMKFNRWVSSGVALGLVAVWRIMTGGWMIRIGDSAAEHWYLEVLPGIASWAIAAILVSGFAQWPAKFLEGYRSKLGIKQESALKESNSQQNKSRVGPGGNVSS